MDSVDNGVTYRQLYAIFDAQTSPDAPLTATRYLGPEDPALLDDLGALLEDAPEFEASLEVRPHGPPQEIRYLVADHPSQYAGYLGFGARTVEVARGPQGEELDLSIVEVTRDHVEWQAQRLLSGGHLRMPGLWYLATLELARAHLAQHVPFAHPVAAAAS